MLVAPLLLVCLIGWYTSAVSAPSSVSTKVPINNLISSPPKPDYTAEVLAPLYKAQAADYARRQAEQERQRALEHEREVQRAQVSAAPVTGDCPVYPGGFDAWLTAAGIPQEDWGCANFIIAHEGGWDPCKVNGGSHDCNYAGPRAYGLGQALPKEKMAPYGADWMTNPVTQLRWMSAYVSKYGSWRGAYIFWQRTDPRPYPGHWY